MQSLTHAVLYTHATDNVAANATPTVSTGTAATQYGPAHLVDLEPSYPAKLLETSGAWLWDFTNPQRLDVAAIIHHNLDAGLEVRLQGNATNVWTAPTVNALFTIPAADEDGFRKGPWLDLTRETGYTTTGFRFWRLVVVGVNSAPVQVGEVWMSATLRTLDPNIQWGAQDGEDHPLVEHRTDFQVSTMFDLGPRQRALAGQVDTTDTNRDALRGWSRSSRGRARMFLLIQDGTVNDAQLVRFTNTKWSVLLNLTDRNVIDLEFEEVSRGLAL
jgi:hypothetical protein